MHKYIVILLSLHLSGCSPPPTASEIGSKYLAAPEKYVQLKEMIIEDSGKRDCFAVGTDHIGDYWEFDGKWNHRGDYRTKLELSDVLSAVHLSNERYEEYLALFDKVEAERIEHCRDTVPWGRWVRVLSYRSGIAVSGCSGTIEWFEEKPPTPYGVRGEGDFLEIYLLEKGWQSMVDCT